jgi:hypothetical protein
MVRFAFVFYNTMPFLPKGISRWKGMCCNLRRKHERRKGIMQGSRARGICAFTTLPTVLPHALGFDFALLLLCLVER